MMSSPRAFASRPSGRLLLVGVRPPSIAHKAATFAHVGLYRRRRDCFPGLRPAPDTEQAWGDSGATKKGRPKAAKGIRFRSLPRAVVQVAEEQPPVVVELSDRGDVPRAVQNGHLGADQAADGFQHHRVAQVIRASDDL